ncbi:hypothetical protein GCM10025857_15120 [Alicyclobacillus contaminans]|uniref:BC1872 family protein n=1 Tax=Alicyclobacillus contaminans TaxID=392016 RepID=UPI0003FF7005|nr:hypothetical protein [Alicyclobacillus contaminans]GMA50155.1 hypothetical protein GCM10025857_15120 [Alicyclobacillus contaminans]
MKWSEMSPRERDALVAEKVMGYTECGKEEPIEYTTHISAAWDVVDRMQQLGWNMDLMNAYIVPEIGRQWGCDLRDGRNLVVGLGPTAPEAICLAALRAVGVDVE